MKTQHTHAHTSYENTTHTHTHTHSHTMKTQYAYTCTHTNTHKHTDPEPEDCKETLGRTGLAGVCRLLPPLCLAGLAWKDNKPQNSAIHSLSKFTLITHNFRSSFLLRSADPKGCTSEFQYNMLCAWCNIYNTFVFLLLLLRWGEERSCCS